VKCEDPHCVFEGVEVKLCRCGWALPLEPASITDENIAERVPKRVRGVGAIMSCPQCHQIYVWSSGDEEQTMVTQ